jgi:hypothetical protein
MWRGTISQSSKITETETDYTQHSKRYYFENLEKTILAGNPELSMKTGEVYPDISSGQKGEKSTW